MGKSVTILAVVTFILLFCSIYLIFGYAPLEKSMLEVQKIFYFHVSAALTLFVAFGINFVFSITYLIKRRNNHDLLAASAAEIGLVFCTITLLSGPIWASTAWDTWWNWEPRLTTTLILWLMYVGYFILRSAIDGENKRTYSAVFGIIAFLDAPIVYYAVDIWQEGLHPDRGTKWDLETTMQYTWMLTLLSFVLLCVFMIIVQYKQKKSEERHEIIRQEHLGKLL